jgi:Glutamate-cysteine ligase
LENLTKLTNLHALSSFKINHVTTIDTRWDAISQSVDDRTRAELGEVAEPEILSQTDTQLAGNGVKRLEKSRYSSVSRYIGKPSSESDRKALEKLNDIDANMDEKTYDEMLRRGIDPLLAGHSFIRPRPLGYIRRRDLFERSANIGPF